MTLAELPTPQPARPNVLHLRWVGVLLAVTVSCGAMAEPIRHILVAQNSAKSSPQASSGIVPMTPEPGMLEKTNLAVGKDAKRWAESYCAAILPLKGREYERFVRLLREETAYLNVNDVAQVPSGKQSLSRYTNHETAKNVFDCLVHTGDTASPEAQFDLFLVIDASPQRVPANPFLWLEKAAEGGYPMAQWLMVKRMGMYDTEGRRGPPAGSFLSEQATRDRYHHLLRKAAEAGVPQARLYLGTLYLGDMRHAWGKELERPAEGIDWLKKAASQSAHESSRNNAGRRLGNLYFEGRVVPQSYVEAFRWYSVIPKEAIVGRCTPWGGVGYRLEQMYREGLGVERDLAKANEYKGSGVCP